MPNRIIKESICYSDDLDKLTAFEETVFYRLLVRVDDYGRIDARPGFLKSMLFVTKKGVTEKSIEDAVSKMASIGLVQEYEVTGKPFLLFPKWSLHQRLRNSKERYPAPCMEHALQQNAEIDHLPQSAATCGELPTESESQSESQSDFMSDANTPDSTEAVITLTLNDKTGYPISQNQASKWEELYPSVNVMQELRNMAGWLDANPSRRKTKTGILRFVNSWLQREQNREGAYHPHAQPVKKYGKAGDKYE